MKQIITTDKAPQAIGPYSQGVHCGTMYFFAGQVPFDPTTGETIGTTTAEQTMQVLANIKALLDSQGLTALDVVKTTVFLRNMDEYPAFNAEYAKLFTENCPARSTVEVSRLPKDVLVEIEVIAMKDTN